MAAPRRRCADRSRAQLAHDLLAVPRGRLSTRALRALWVSRALRSRPRASTSRRCGAEGQVAGDAEAPRRADRDGEEELVEPRARRHAAQRQAPTQAWPRVLPSSVSMAPSSQGCSQPRNTQSSRSSALARDTVTVTPSSGSSGKTASSSCSPGRSTAVCGLCSSCSTPATAHSFSR
jgi:hypothetical protein